jgi:hypothetical protein
MVYISNNSSFSQKHPGVRNGLVGSGGTSYYLMEYYTLHITQATGRVARRSTWEHPQHVWEHLESQ